MNACRNLKLVDTIAVFFFKLEKVFGNVSKHLGLQVTGNTLLFVNLGRKKGHTPSYHSPRPTVNQSPSRSSEIKEIPGGQKETRCLWSHMHLECLSKARQLLPKSEFVWRQHRFRKNEFLFSSECGQSILVRRQQSQVHS